LREGGGENDCRKPRCRPAIASGIVAPNVTNLVLLFALDRIPVSTHRLVCHWHRNADGRLVCRWKPIHRSRILDPKQPVERFVSRDGSNIVPA
jgi:hypothetical protein